MTFPVKSTRVLWRHARVAADRRRSTASDLETWAALATVLEWLPSALDAQLQRDAGLTHFEYGILYALADAPDRTLRMSVLAGYANSSLSRLSRAASRLEAKGWVDATARPHRRALHPGRPSPTPGRQKVDQATPGHVATVRRLVLDPLTAGPDAAAAGDQPADHAVHPGRARLASAAGRGRTTLTR